MEEVTYPTYANQNPANTRVQAGLPAPGALGSPEAAHHIDATPSTRDLATESDRPASRRDRRSSRTVYERLGPGATSGRLHGPNRKP